MQFQPFVSALRAIAAALCALAVVSGVLLGAKALKDRPIDLGPMIETRDVYALVDATRTMDPEARGASGGINFTKAKSIVTSGILPRLGPGDRFGAYRVGTAFTERGNAIVNGSLGAFPARLRDAAVAKRHPETVDTWLQQAQAAKQEGQWVERVESLGIEPPGRSDYFSALEYIARRCRAAAAGRRTCTLVVIGDLEQNPAPVPFVPPAPEEDEAAWFEGVDVRLVSPFRVATGRAGRARDLEAFWSTYFRERGAAEIAFATFDDQDPPIGLNVLDGARASHESGR